MGIGAMCRMYHVETVPFTDRTHLVLRSGQALRLATELHFLDFKKDKAPVILPANHESSVRVNRVLSKIVGAICCPRLANRAEEPLGWVAGLDWEAVVIRDDGSRAMCWDCAGKIVVYTGLLERVETDEELASVLAHEVGRVIARHSSEIIEIFANWKCFPSFLLTPLFRRRELEADYIGMLLLAASGFDPHVAPCVFKKLRTIGKIYISKKLRHSLGLSTHPSSNERTKMLLRPKVMKEAMELYIQVASTGQGSSNA